MPIRREVVADDGLHQAERIAVSHDASKAKQRAMIEWLTDNALASTFEGAIGPAEHYWRGVPADPKAKPLSKPWYRARILREADRLRKVLASPETERLHPNLEFWIVTAINLGARLEEAQWRFGIGPSARLGRRIRQKNRENAKKGVRARADAKRRDDEGLIAAVRTYHREHSDHSRRTMAKNLLSKFGRPNNRNPIDALAKRIGRLEK